MAAQLENVQPTDRRVQTFFRKTEFCHFFEAGRCLKGDDCNFAHGQDDIKSMPDFNKTAMCKAWAQGSCKLSSEQCAFAHGRDELRKSRDGLRKSELRKSGDGSKNGGSGENTVFNISEDEKGYCQKVLDSDSICQVERELKTSMQAPQGQSEASYSMELKTSMQAPQGQSEASSSIKYASQNMIFQSKLVKDQGLSKPEDGGPDFLWLSASMFCALPSPTQQVLLSKSLVLSTNMHTNMATCFDKKALCRNLLESMPDHYDD